MSIWVLRADCIGHRAEDLLKNSLPLSWDSGRCEQDEIVGQKCGFDNHRKRERNEMIK